MKHNTVFYALIVTLLFVPAYAMNDTIEDIIKTEQSDTPSLITRAALTEMCVEVINIPLSCAVDYGINQALPADHKYHNQASTISAIVKKGCSMPISWKVSAFLTDRHIIPPAPCASNPTQSITHLAIEFATGCAVNSALRMLVTQNLNKNYDKKGKLIAKITAMHALTENEHEAFKQKFNNDDKIVSEFPHWNPQSSADTKHIAAESTEQSYTAKKVLSKNLRSTLHARRFSYEIWQRKSALIIGEKIPLSNKSEFLRVTQYETAGTFWNYNLPFGIHRLRPAMQQLLETIKNNHITMAGVPFKEMITRPGLLQ